MKESYWGYWLILLGVFVVVVMILTQNATTTSTQDYYQLKEVGNSAMFDAIDYSYYSQTGQIRMLKEVFVENFIRRYAETIKGTNTYQIDFFDLYESPPKASIKISTQTGNYIIADTATNLDIVNSIDLIIEYSDPKKSNAEVWENIPCEYYAD